MKLNFSGRLSSLLFGTGLLFTNSSIAEVPAGLWLAACSNGVYRSQIYQSRSVALVERFHQDQACGDISFEFETKGNVNYPPAPTQIDFTYEKIFLTLHKAVLVADFNQREVCGLPNWQLHIPQDITGLDCAIFNFNHKTKIPSAGEIKYGIYLVKDHSLFFGRMSPLKDGSSPDRRPVDINLSTEYIFQN